MVAQEKTVDEMLAFAEAGIRAAGAQIENLSSSKSWYDQAGHAKRALIEQQGAISALFAIIKGAANA